MTYFKLSNGVFFVKGALRGAILDTNTKNVYSINATGVSILEGQTENEQYWQKLVAMGIAETCDKQIGLPELPKAGKTKLNFIWFEVVTNDCNESCIHCYADSMPPTHRKDKGLPITPQDTHNKITFDDWCKLIKEGYELGCRACQFIGGEPFVYRDGEKTILDLAEYARDTGYKSIEIFTNATLLTNRVIQKIKDLGLKIATSLYSNDPIIHDAITQTPGSHAKTIRSLKQLKAANIPTRVEVVAMKQNEGTVKNTIQLIESFGFRTKGPDPLRPKGRGENIAIMPSPATTVRYGVMIQPNFSAERNVIAQYAISHSCLAGKITITEAGDVLPCIFSRNQVIGNVLEENGLKSVISKTRLQKIWNTTKDDVMVCKDCEYRYVCFDCRPLSEAASLGNASFLQAPYPRCSYNPYTGEWAKGLWRLQETKPIYERRYEPIFQKVKADGEVAVNSLFSH